MEKDTDKKCMKCGITTNNYVECKKCGYTVCLGCDDFEIVMTLMYDKTICPKCGGIECH